MLASSEQLYRVPGLFQGSEQVKGTVCTRLEKRVVKTKTVVTTRLRSPPHAT